ncbi:hypothetical protein C8R42DRAFT_587116 [Lentinula raphanica]|nr:hypothetical protein C8R42DRAFT_587116 [Lentinula raphanica]
MLPESDLDDIIANPKIFQDLNHHEQLLATISYPLSAKPAYGAFKRSYPGATSSIPLFSSQLKEICLKQAFYRRQADKTPHVYKGVSQGTALSTELNCLGWAAALLRTVYRFIEDTQIQPSFNVPQLQYVGSALAVSQNEAHDSFLVEELISDSPFVKYINNDSAKPVKLASAEQSKIARFLAFAQHVQWIKTRGLVFTSDFQGGGRLLTDPQIITRP